MYLLPDTILDRFCLKILAKVHHKMKWLNLESITMKHILLATNYPNLSGLGLHGIDVGEVVCLFSHDTVFTDLIKYQTSSLVIEFSQNEKQIAREDLDRIVLIQIFTMFINLNCLHFDSPSVNCQRLLFEILPSSIIY